VFTVWSSPSSVLKVFCVITFLFEVTIHTLPHKKMLGWFPCVQVISHKNALCSFPRVQVFLVLTQACE